MIADFHFLRPWWLLLIVPLLGILILLWRQNPRLHAWGEVCDSHLLEHLLQRKGQGKRMVAMSFILLSTFFMILSISGPAWFKLPVATYKAVDPRVMILDMSDNMMLSDLTPSRLERAKFKLHDLLMHKDVGQFGMIVFTGEPFIVSPLTDDGQTISSLLSSLTPDIMPVGGQNLDTALSEAKNLINQAGYGHGQILVLTADTPSSEAIKKAQDMAKSGIRSSIMPMRADNDLNPLFQNFAHAGQGQIVKYSSDSSDLAQWLNNKGNKEYALSQDDDVPLWRDEGRWFLIPALLLLLPAFRRGWLQKVAV